MEGIKVSLFIILFTVFSTCGVPYPWEEAPKPQMRLYMPNDEFKKSWRAEDLDNSVALFYDPWYDSSKPILLLAHGWFQSAEDNVIVLLLDSLFEIKFYEKMNIMVLDAPYFLDSVISNISYFHPAKNIEMLGNIVADIFNKAIELGLTKAENINLVGLSLGSHVSGYIGRAVMDQVHSIVGLDPAGPGFDSTLQYLTHFQHVSKSDARFVHLYHTNSMSFGTSERLGTADFEFNEGISQPGCATSIDPKCSHKRAFFIFNDLILGDKALLALKCDSQNNFKDCSCRDNPTVVLQYPVDTSAEGIHFLKTNSQAPFGLGEEGVMCWDDQWEILQKEKEVEKSKTASALLEITEKFKRNMALLQKKETYLAMFKTKGSSEEVKEGATNSILKSNI